MVSSSMSDFCVARLDNEQHLLGYGGPLFYDHFSADIQDTGSKQENIYIHYFIFFQIKFSLCVSILLFFGFMVGLIPCWVSTTD